MTANSRPRRTVRQEATEATETTEGALATLDGQHVEDGYRRAPRLTVEERRAQGHSMRQRAPRSAHAHWEAPADRPDPIALLEAQGETRVPELVPIRYARMSASPFAFLRGSAVVMTHDLSRTPVSGIMTQACGDCHCANFGGYASPERTLLFDINDFDETHLGPWEWDVKRLAASLVVAGRGNGFSDADCHDAAQAAARAYREHMAQFAEMPTMDVWYARVTADDLFNMIKDRQTKKRAQAQVTKARRSDSARAALKLTEVVDNQVRFINDPPLVMRMPEDALGAAAVYDLFNQYAQTLRAAQRQVLERFTVVDVAQKVVGVGSVGTRCFIVLLAGRDEQDPLILQVKEAQESVLAPYVEPRSEGHQGERVVTGQELMQAASDIFLGWLTGPNGRHFYWRQLRDMKVSAAIETFTAANLCLYGELCGWALARAHARASGKAIEISSYLGANDRFDQAVATFAQTYADQNERDYQALISAIRSGRLQAAPSGS